MDHTSYSLRQIFTRRSSENVGVLPALRDINLSIYAGDRVGVLGRNGAGKTTLLRVLSGIYPPTNSFGGVHIRGQVCSLTDFSLGMDPDDSGSKNIVSRLIYMGYRKQEAKQVVEEVIEFAGLQSAADAPVRTYSTGMYLRLAFAISTQFTPDILIMDEVIGAGDQHFRQRAADRIEHLIGSSRAMVLSSHDIAAVRQFCNRVLILEAGQVIFDGGVEEGIEKYCSFSAG